MIFNKYLFSCLCEPPRSHVEVGNKNKIPITGSGSIHMNILQNGRSVQCKLESALLVPNLGYQLLSAQNLNKDGLCTTFDNGQCWMKRKTQLVASGTLGGN